MSANSSDLSGRTFLITGANTGIGLATATGLAKRGGKVFVACRSAEKGRAAVAGISAETGNDAVAFLPLDLADLASVRACAQEFLARGEPLHALINNAGVGGARGLTKDGFELTFGINHLGHFALTTALLGCLAASASAGGHRVQRRPLQAQGSTSRRCAGHGVPDRAAKYAVSSWATCCSARNSPAAQRGAASRPTRCTPGWSPRTSGGGFPGRYAR
jgi:NAD(P)-dependent dehydrogenase (short-subunit alcohol dehydrogenase family)